MAMARSQDYAHLFKDKKIFRDKQGKPNFNTRFIDRYKYTFNSIQALLVKYGLSECCEVNPELLRVATLEYFDEVFEMKQAHKIDHSQPEKIYSHQIFWLLRNHPIQIIDFKKLQELDKLEYLHINERAFTDILVRRIAIELEERFEKNIQIDDFVKKLEKHKLMKEFRRKLYYTFKRRIYTSKSLLMTIEAFMSSAQFVLQIT